MSDPGQVPEESHNVYIHALVTSSFSLLVVRPGDTSIASALSLVTSNVLYASTNRSVNNCSSQAHTNTKHHETPRPSLGTWLQAHQPPPKVMAPLTPQIELQSVLGLTSTQQHLQHLPLRCRMHCGIALRCNCHRLANGRDLQSCALIVALRLIRTRCIV